MAECLDCRKNCLDPKTDYCVQYTGPDIAAVGITNGMWYDELTVSLANTLVEYIQKTVDLDCLYDNTCGNCSQESLIPDAVQVLINKICSLTTDDFVYNGGLYCLGNGSISADAVKLLGRGFTYYSTSVGETSSFGINLSSATENLPNGHSVSSFRTVVSGKKKGGKTTIVDTNHPTSVFSVDYDRYPVVVDATIKVNTPTGEVSLNQTLSIPSPFSGEKQGSLAVRDFSRSVSYGLTQSSFNELVAAQTCQNKQDIDQMKNLDMADCGDKIKYPSKDVKAIIGIQASALCDHEERIEDLEKVKFRECSDVCGDNLLELTPQEAWTKVTDLVCTLQQELKDLKEEVKALRDKVACCECG